jgi:predicted nucleotidyltransferase
MKHGIYNRSFQIIYERLRKEPEIEKAVLFGSRAMGNAKKGSDIDIAIFGKDINQELIDKISTKLNQEEPIPYFIDIIDYKTINNEKLKQHIDEHGVTIFEQVSSGSSGS